jgi:DNA-directed RNA polymerase subunit N (RpoN/RPB10)
MCKTRCYVCGRDYTESAHNREYEEFGICFPINTCKLCGVTLQRALAGFVELLRESHGERRERVLDRLVGKLNEQGFAIKSFPRRTA